MLCDNNERQDECRTTQDRRFILCMEAASAMVKVDWLHRKSKTGPHLGPRPKTRRPLCYSRSDPTWPAHSGPADST